MRTVITSDRLSDADTDFSNGRRLTERIGETDTKPDEKGWASVKCFQLGMHNLFGAFRRTYRSATFALRSGWDVPEINLISFMIEAVKSSYNFYAGTASMSFRRTGLFFNCQWGRQVRRLGELRSFTSGIMRIYSVHKDARYIILRLYQDWNSHESLLN